MATKHYFEIGTKIGKWTIESQPYLRKSHYIYDCVCDCGKQNTVSASNLGLGKSTQCNRCASAERGEKTKRQRSLIGRRFGSLLVKKRLPKAYKGHTYYWLCDCDCGQEHMVCHSNLTSGKTTSCGCQRPTGSESSLWQGYGEIGLTYWNSIIEGAADRNLKVEVSIEQAWNLFLAQHRRCALTGQLLVMHVPGQRMGDASLDRIDSQKGYLIDNVQWVHKDINLLKGAWLQSDFIDMCIAVADHFHRRL